jgi:hypothetical protein
LSPESRPLQQDSFYTDTGLLTHSRWARKRTHSFDVSIYIFLLIALLCEKKASSSRVVQRSSRGLKGGPIPSSSSSSKSGDDSKVNNIGRGLQGSPGLPDFDFTGFNGAVLFGSNSAGGSTNNQGAAETQSANGTASTSGTGNFTVTSGSSGFFTGPGVGTIEGASEVGSTGSSQAAGSTVDVGDTNVTGSSDGQVNSAFGGVLSDPFGFPGVGVGPTGGFASVLGNFQSSSMGTGQGNNSAVSSSGSGNTFGNSQLIANNIFGDIAGGTATGVAQGITFAGGMPGAGNSSLPGVPFTVNGTTTNSFNNGGSGFFFGNTSGGVLPGFGTGNQFGFSFP